MLSIGFKEAVYTIRKRKGLTQETCAKRADMDPRLWSKYETGKARITEQALERMRLAMRCSEAELFHLALPRQHAYHSAKMGEVRESAPVFGTTAAAAQQAQKLMALDEKAIAPEDRHWFVVERDGLAALLTRVSGMAENMVEKYLYLIGKARRVKDEEDDKKRSED